MASEITLKQLSKYSGFSISTISKALNDKCDISEKTKNKIKKLAENYNYIPNNAAITLRSNKTKIIGVIVPKINSKIYGNIVSKIQEATFNKGYRLLLLQSFKSDKKELECINNIRVGFVDGFILIRPFQKKDVSINKLIFYTNSNYEPTVFKEVDLLNKNFNQYYKIIEESINLFLDIIKLK